MDRKAIEAELNRKKKELAKLQKQFLKAENGHRSQKNRMTAQQTSLADAAGMAVPTAVHVPSLTARDARDGARFSDLTMPSCMDSTKMTSHHACSSPQNITNLQTKSTFQDIRTTSQDTMVSTCTTFKESQTERTTELNDHLNCKIESCKSCGNNGNLNYSCTPQELLNQGYFEDGPHTRSCAEGPDIPTEGPNVSSVCPPDTSTNTDHCKTQPPSRTHMPHLPSSHAVPTSPHATYTQHASETHGAVMLPFVEPLPLPSRVSFPLVSMPTTQLDFYLPDTEYQAMKLLKLTAVKNGSTGRLHGVVLSPGLGRSGTGTQTSGVTGECGVQPRPVSVEAVSTRAACTEPTLAHPTQLGYYGHQNDCGIRPNCYEGSKNACVREHMFDGTIKDTYGLDSSFSFKTTAEVMRRRLLGVALTKGTLSIVHLDEGSVCVHLLPTGPNTNWLYASWKMQQRELVESCFLLVQEKTTFCFVAMTEDQIVTCVRLCIVNSDEGYMLNMAVPDKSCSRAQIHSWPSGDQVLVAMALTEEELCLSIVRVWALVKDDDTCRWQMIDGLGTQLPLPKSVGIIVSLCEVVGVTQQLLGSTSTSAVLWDVRSHGLLVVVTLCCCLSGCELQPVVVTTIAEEVCPFGVSPVHARLSLPQNTLFLLLGCKYASPTSSKQSREYEDGRPSAVAWLVACKTTAPPASVPNDCLQTTHCDLVQSYTCTSTQPWGYQWCEGTSWNFAARVSHNALVLWNLLSTNPYGALSFGDNLDVGSGDIEVYWVSDRKQMIIVSGDSVHILSQQSKPAALGM